MMSYIMNRLKEVSTWQGIAVGLTILGIKLTPDQVGAVVTMGMAVVSAISVFLPAHASSLPTMINGKK